MKKKERTKILKFLYKILNEITVYCGQECNNNECCPEEDCVLYRIENLVVKFKDKIEEKI